MFQAIAHPLRRELLGRLKDTELSAGELAEPYAMSFGAVSQHLRLLEEAALVTVRRAGRHRMYRLSARPLRHVGDFVDEFTRYFDARLDALGDYLDAKHGRSE